MIQWIRTSRLTTKKPFSLRQGGGLVVGALARTTLGPSLLTACNVEVFDPIVSILAVDNFNQVAA